jgi:hypothetical protein
MAKEFNSYSYPGSMDNPADEELYQKNSVMAPPASRLRKIMDFVLGGKSQGDRMTNAVTQMAPAAIIPGKKIPGVFQGKLKGFRGNPNAATRVDAEALHMADAPFAVGNIDKLPLNNKGPYSAFLDPASGNMAYTEALHSHDPLQRAASTYLDNIDNENTYGKLRRIAYQGAGGEKGVTHIVPPYFSPNKGVAHASMQEDRAIEDMIKLLQSKGLSAPGEDFQSRKFWKLNDLGQ